MEETFFNVKKFPHITFNSRAVMKANHTWILLGAVKMMGVEKELEIPFQFTHEAAVVWVFDEPRIAAKGSLEINRSDFNIPSSGWNDILPTLGSMTLSDKVVINLIIQGVGPSLSALLLDIATIKGTKVAIREYEHMKSKNEGYSFGARSLIGVSKNFIDSNKIEQAIEFSAYAVKQEPENYIGYYYLGLSHKAAGNKKTAIANFEQALKLKPDLDRAKTHIEELKKSRN